MKLRALTHAENVAVLTLYKIYGSKVAWPDHVRYHIGKAMMANLQQRKILQRKTVGGEEMIVLSDVGLAMGRSLKESVNVDTERLVTME